MFSYEKFKTNFLHLMYYEVTKRVPTESIDLIFETLKYILQYVWWHCPFNTCTAGIFLQNPSQKLSFRCCKNNWSNISPLARRKVFNLRLLSFGKAWINELSPESDSAVVNDAAVLYIHFFYLPSTPSSRLYFGVFTRTPLSFTQKRNKEIEFKTEII
jgi:hypothetical protein